MKILVAVDGSAISLRALKFAIRLTRRLADTARLTVLAVDMPLFPGVDRKIGSAAAKRYHAENHEMMLAPTRKILARAKLEAHEVAEIGEIADTILAVARSQKSDLIVMGSHGRSAVKGVLLGSVSTKVIAQTGVPVTIVR